jgi:hypothetical protein
MPQLLKTFSIIAASCFFSSLLFAQQNYWQQQANYIIDVTLNDNEHTLEGFEKLEYINNSPDTLTFIWMHLWPNAYKNDKTAFSDQLLENGNTNFYFSEKEQRGYINRLDFKVNNITAEIEDHPQFADIIKLVLPAPLAPKQKIIITTPFHEKLPYNFSRGGHVGKSYQITQWYPKPAVYDQQGWHPMPYLDQGEFYSEFGNFDVRITLPKNYVVAATGNLQDEDEKRWLLSIRSENENKESPTKKKSTKQGGDVFKKQKLSAKKPQEPAIKEELKTLRYLQNNVHDFAWFADKNFNVVHDTIRLNEKVIDAFVFYLPQNKEAWKNSMQTIKNTIKTRNEWIGAYPYDVVSVVNSPQEYSGGMEYPTITVISNLNNEAALNQTIEHEVGHNWFYGILQNNERRYAWLDEGINSYYDQRFLDLQKDQQNLNAGVMGKVSPKDLERLLFETSAHEKTDQPINTSSEKLSVANYGLVEYYKASQVMKMLESYLGIESFDKAMQAYFNKFAFKHVYPKDLQQTLEHSSGKNLDSIFSLLDDTGILPGREREGWKTANIFNLKRVGDYIKNPSKNLLFFSPAIGANVYDKLMIGGLVTNYKLPPSSFQFIAVPMYATGTKKFTGIGKLNYSFFPGNIFRKADIFVNASTFSMNDYTDETDKKTSLSFLKIVPGLRLTANEKNPRSTIKKYLQWKTFLISEDGFTFFSDTIINGIDTAILSRTGKKRNSQVFNELKVVIENERALYPFSAEIKAEQGKDFLRAGFTGKYFFNYPKEGGLQVRLFAGKFFYTTSKTSNKQFSTQRYHLNMTGANGYENYTYSDYFIGRNEFEGLPAQQIMIRDGAFKVRTDLLSEEVGKTDDWLIATNFSTTIPAKINPLQVLPVKIPLRIFVDIGTYADAWKKNAEEDRFLFDAGLQISLLKESINIYVPLIYSKVYKDYIQSTIPGKRLLKTISFSIDLSRLNSKQFNKLLPF